MLAGGAEGAGPKQEVGRGGQKGGLRADRFLFNTAVNLRQPSETTEVFWGRNKTLRTHLLNLLSVHLKKSFFFFFFERDLPFHYKSVQLTKCQHRADPGAGRSR